MFCGDLRREPDGRWFFGSTYLGRDGELRPVRVSAVGDRLGVVAAQLAELLRKTCDAMDGWGDPVAVQAGRDTLRRFERWKGERGDGEQRKSRLDADSRSRAWGRCMWRLENRRACRRTC